MLLRLSAGSWTRETSGVRGRIFAIDGFASDAPFLAAGALWRRSAGSFSTVTADLGLRAIDVNNGELWAAGSGGVVASPSFAPQGVSASGNGVFFEGTNAFVVEQGGQIEGYGAAGARVGVSTPVSTAALLAITGVAASFPGQAAQPRLTWDGGAPLRLAPGASITITPGFEDPCGATPGVCVQVCARSSRCASTRCSVVVAGAALRA